MKFLTDEESKKWKDGLKVINCIIDDLDYLYRASIDLDAYLGLNIDTVSRYAVIDNIYSESYYPLLYKYATSGYALPLPECIKNIVTFVNNRRMGYFNNEDLETFHSLLTSINVKQ